MPCEYDTISYILTASFKAIQVYDHTENIIVLLAGCAYHDRCGITAKSPAGNTHHTVLLHSIQCVFCEYTSGSARYVWQEAGMRLRKIPIRLSATTLVWTHGSWELLWMNGDTDRVWQWLMGGYMCVGERRAGTGIIGRFTPISALSRYGIPLMRVHPFSTCIDNFWEERYTH